MPAEVIMPKVDMDMATGKLSVWHVSEGEAVSKGAPLFDIETDKAAMEVESPASGRLHHVIAAPGATVAVGAPRSGSTAGGGSATAGWSRRPVPTSGSSANWGRTTNCSPAVASATVSARIQVTAGQTQRRRPATFRSSPPREVPAGVPIVPHGR